MGDMPRRVSLRRIWSDLRADGGLLIRGNLAAVLVAVAGAFGPAIIGATIDHGVADGDLMWVVIGTVAFLVTSAVRLVAQLVQTRLMGRFGQAYMRRLRRELVDQMFALDLDFYARERTGKLVARLTNDVETLQNFVEHGLALVARTFLMITITLVVMVISSPLMALVVVVLLAPLGIATMVFRRKAFPAQVEVRDRMAELLGHVNESLTGVRVIQAYTYENPRREAFRRANVDTYAAKVETFRLNSIYYAVVELLQPVAVGLVIAVGAKLALNGSLTVGAVVAFTLYLGQLFEPIQQLTELAQALQMASAAFGKVFGFRDERPMVADAPDAVPFVPGPGEVCLDDVRFRYGANGPEVLQGVTLHVPPGQRVALIGTSGAGKSTLARLVTRFYDVTAGAVAVDGQDVRDVIGATLREHVALVPQEGFLFNGTIADNIAVARDGATREDVDAACRALGIAQRLSMLPEGLDTDVSNHGMSLSSGQRQLIALARALIAGPRVIILDEATSNLDPATDALVEDALVTLLAGRTALIIAHRVETAMRADRVVMMRHGTIVEDGAPDDLVADGGAFGEWVRSVREIAGTAR